MGFCKSLLGRCSARWSRWPAHAALGIAASFLATASGCSEPARGECDENGPIRTVCGFHNPEDLVALPDGDFFVVSEMRRDAAGGALALWREGGEPRRLWPGSETPGIEAGPAAGDPSCPPPVPGAFAPHGVFAAPPGLYVVNHGGRESIEIFSLENTDGTIRARWRGCVELPADSSANDVAVGPRGVIAVSNMGTPGGSLRASIAGQLGLDTGDVLLWRSGEGWSQVPGSETRSPNGVAFSPDGGWVYWAESAGERVRGARLDGSEPVEFPVAGRPDNLAWDSSGALHVAAHESFLGLAGCLARRPCRGGWEIFRIEPKSGQVTSLLRHDGDRIGAVATAQPVGERIYLSAVFDDRIGVWSPGSTR